MNATMTKRRLPESAFAGLAEHDRKVAQAQLGPSLIQAERRAVTGDYATARNENRFSASLPVDERDAKRHGELLEAMTRAEIAAGKPWDDELAGAHIAVERAEAERQRYIDENFADLVASLTERATKARVDEVKAIAALVATRDETQRIREAWAAVLGPIGRYEAGNPEETHQRLLGFSVNIGQVEQNLRVENRIRLEALVQQAWILQRELELRPLPRLVPAAIDDEVGGVIPGAS